MIKHHNKLHAALPPGTIIKKRVTDGRTGLLIKKYIHENLKHSANDICHLLMGELGPGIPIPSKATVNCFLDMNSYVIRAMKSETLICPVNVQKRFNWAQEYSKMDPNFWNHVIWSDETSIQAIHQNSEVHIRVHKLIDSKEIPKKPRAQGGGFTVMFWGWLGWMFHLTR